MKEFFNKYKWIILPLILVMVFIFGVIATWGKWGHAIYDCFREAMLPQAILDGKILYRDITNLYPPLGYQFNAFLYFVFGNSLNTLYWAGIINSLLILSVIYFIVKKYSSDLIAFISVLSIMEILVFRVYASNTTISWIFPYSYSYIYAFSTCLLSLLFYILYRENNKSLYLILSFLFIGLSLAFKLDFILFALLPIYGLIKHKSLKTALISTGVFIAPFLTSIAIYMITGGTLNDLQNEIKFLMDFSHAPSVIEFNKGVMPQWFKPWVMAKVGTSFKCFAFIGILVFLYTYVSVFVISKVKNIHIKGILGTVLFFTGYFSIIKYAAIFQFSQSELHTDLVYVPYIVTISALVIFTVKLFIKKKEFKFSLPEFSRKEKFYFLITISAILISFRTFALLNASHIGNFMLAIWWAAFVYLVLGLCPEYFPDIFKKENLKKTLCLFFMAYPLYFVFVYTYNSTLMTNKINSNKGTYYNSVKYHKTVNETLDFIENNIPSDKTLLVMEEGLIFNYLSGRKTNLKYYALIPHMVDTYGEEAVIKDLAQNPPDYIFITNNIYITEKLGGAFGVHYAKNITAFVLYNYDYIKTIKNPDIEQSLEITIFKLKNK